MNVAQIQGFQISITKSQQKSGKNKGLQGGPSAYSLQNIQQYTVRLRHGSTERWKNFGLHFWGILRKHVSPADTHFIDKQNLI